jgi:hypothetical protein
VQPARDLVAVAAELSAGMELREDDLQSRPPLVGHDVDRNAGPVVANGDRVVRMECDFDALVAAGESLVDRVVDDFVDEMVEASRARRADVHARPKPDRFEALQNGDVFCCITVLCHQKSPANGQFPRPMKSIRSSGWNRRPN